MKKLSELTKIYRRITKLNFIDIDELVDSTSVEDLPYLYLRLIWNIPRGNLLILDEDLTKDFAYVIYNLALRVNLNLDSEDIIPDGVIDSTDFRVKADIDFARKILEIADDIVKVLKLLTEDGRYVLTETSKHIIVE